MTEKKKLNVLADVIELHKPTEVHWLFFLGSTLAIFGLVKMNYQATASTVADTCRTLLALNGTLLALVVGFSAFYFAVIDARRIQANQPATPEWFNEIKQAAAPLLINRYKKKMRAVSILLVSIALSYAVILIVTYVLYLFSLSQTSIIGQPSSWGLALYFVVLSPIVTVADPVIMTWYLTSDVAGSTKYRCPYCEEVFDDSGKYLNHINDCPKRPKEIIYSETPES